MEPQLLLRVSAAPRTLAAQGVFSRLARPSACIPTTSSLLSQQQQRRTKLTSARTRRALMVPPHPSFLEPAQDQDYIIFNPPASEPSVYHTPFKFLPKSDPRRRDNLGTLFSSTTIKYSENPSPSSSISTTPGSESDSNPNLPPAIKKALPPQPSLREFYSVTKEEVAEMRRLRAEDPVKWSVVALAKKFNTTKLFVMIAAGAKTMTAHRKRMEAEVEAVKERWGPKRTQAREDRQKRRQMLLRGEL